MAVGKGQKKSQENCLKKDDRSLSLNEFVGAVSLAPSHQGSVGSMSQWRLKLRRKAHEHLSHLGLVLVLNLLFAA
jgi:hypothetical protein